METSRSDIPLLIQGGPRELLGVACDVLELVWTQLLSVVTMFLGSSAGGVGGS